MEGHSNPLDGQHKSGSMMTKSEMIEWIDNASSCDLLYKWRFDRGGSPFFQGEVGEHYSNRIFDIMRNKPNEWSAASKAVGWDG